MFINSSTTQVATDWIFQRAAPNAPSLLFFNQKAPNLFSLMKCPHSSSILFIDSDICVGQWIDIHYMVVYEQLIKIPCRVPFMN